MLNDPHTVGHEKTRLEVIFFFVYIYICLNVRLSQSGFPQILKYNTPSRHYQPFIPTALFVVPAGDFPELRLKAWSSRVITAFVSVCLQDLSAQYTDAARPPLLAAATMACAKLAEWMLLVEKYPRLLTEEQSDHLYKVGWETLSCY